MKAIIKNGCQQFKVTEGDYIKIMPIQSPEGASISFDNVIMAFDENNAMLPTSKTSSIKVTGVVKKHGKYKKIRGYMDFDTILLYSHTLKSLSLHISKLLARYTTHYKGFPVKSKTDKYT